VSDIERQIATVFSELAPRLALLLMNRYRLSRDEAADLVQNVFLSLLDRSARDALPSYEPEHLRNYIIRAAHSRAIDAMRREARHRKYEDVLLSTLTFFATGTDAEERVIQDQQRQMLREAIDNVGEPYRAIFKLLIYEELSLASIARRLDVSLGSIYTQYARGVEKLRSLVEKARKESTS
jgi:RNA polymerase sigma factor (sigma-70 family)